MISISIYLFLLKIYSNYYYTFSKIDSKSFFLGHLSNCGLGKNLIYDTSTFGDVQHLCQKGSLTNWNQKVEKCMFMLGIQKELWKIILVVIKITRCLYSTNTKFLDNDYVNNLKAKCRTILEEKCQLLLQENYKIHLEIRQLYQIHHNTLFYRQLVHQYNIVVKGLSNYLINSYFWDKLEKLSHKNMNLILDPMQRQQMI